MSDGGSIESVSIKNRIFSVAADADAERDLGGFTVERMSNGDGSVRRKKTRKPWMLSGLTLSIDDNNQDQEFLQGIADGEEEVAITVTYVSGITYGGTGGLEGDLKFGNQNTTADVTLAGGFKLEQQ